MKKVAVMLFLLAGLVFGGMAQEKIDRIVEDGVEVINNHLESYKLKGESTSLMIARGGRLYSLIKNKNGYKELVVYRMTWK
jgi:hypothetical protein